MKRNKLLTHLMVVIMFLVVGIGCQGIKLPFSDGTGLGGSPEPKEAIQTALKKFMEAKFYHSTVKTRNAQTSVETQIEFNAPDKFWIKSDIGTMKSEVIAIGDDSYMRMNDGKWSKMPGGKSLPTGELRGKMSAEAVAAMKDFESAGHETLDGKDTLVYTFKSDYGGQSSSKMWISTETGLPLRVDTDGTYSGNKLQMSITYDFDKETRIEAPNVN